MPIKYNPKAKCPKFEKFLNEIFLNKVERVNFMKIILGYALLGVPKEEILIYLYGKHGRNGKGTLMKIIQHVFGSLAKTFNPEILLVQRNPPSSSAPNPELVNLKGVRFAIFSEVNKGKEIDSAKVKNLSGRDTISCRPLFSNVDQQIRPVAYNILTNEPQAKSPF